MKRYTSNENLIQEANNIKLLNELLEKIQDMSSGLNESVGKNDKIVNEKFIDEMIVSLTELKKFI